MNKNLILALCLGVIYGCSNNSAREYQAICEIENSKKMENINLFIPPKKVAINVISDNKIHYKNNIFLALTKSHIPLLPKLNSVEIPVDHRVREKYEENTAKKLGDRDLFVGIERSPNKECQRKNIIEEFEKGYFGKNDCIKVTSSEFTKATDTLTYEEKSNNPNKYPRYDQENIYINGKLISTKSFFYKKSPHLFVLFGQSEYGISCIDHQ